MHWQRFSAAARGLAVPPVVFLFGTHDTLLCRELSGPFRSFGTSAIMRFAARFVCGVGDAAPLLWGKVYHTFLLYGRAAFSGGGCPRPTIQKTAQRLGCAASSKLSFCQQELIPYLNYPAYPRYQLQVRSGHRSGRPPCCPVQRCRLRHRPQHCRYQPCWNPGCSAPTPAGHRNW